MSLTVAASLTLAALAPWGPTQAPSAPVDVPIAQTAAADARQAVLRFELRDDETGELIPGRLTFMGEGGPQAELFPGVGAQPRELAVRKNVVYTKTGSGALTVPAGSYVIYASRGIEWSLTAEELELREGQVYTWKTRLRHELDTAGQVSGDFHLHTLTHSGHGDANLEERIISLIGEGVEFAVATDHNHHTDYGPTIERLGVESLLGHTVGNEVSTPLGHFNTFPLDPARPPVGAHLNDGTELFSLLRAEPNPSGIRPVIQLNHPRWGNIDYFGKTELDPVTGRPGSARFSYDFDTIELLNENPGWGYFDAEHSKQPTGSSEHHLLQDWYNLLNRGRDYAAVGNSDSHTVHSAFAGYPRNYVPSAATEPGRIDVVEVAAALRAGQVFTTTGPFVDVSIDGVRMGGEVRAVRSKQSGASSAEVSVHVRIQAASWIDCDRFFLVVNGQVRRELDVPENGQVVRLDQTFQLHLERDAWVAVIVEGDDPILPLTGHSVREVRPLAITNPIRVDVGADGWLAPLETAKRALRTAAEFSGVRAVHELKGFGPKTGLDLLLLAAPELGSEPSPELLPALLQRAFDSWDRRCLLAAARCIERLPAPAYLPLLEEVFPRTSEDVYARLALLRARKACGDPQFTERMSEWMLQAGSRLQVYASELDGLIPGRAALDWQVVGPFGSQQSEPLGPEQYAGIGAEDLKLEAERRFEGAAGKSVGWRAARAAAGGYLDLGRLLSEAGEPTESVVCFAQTWVFAPASGDYSVAFGSDDGVTLWIGDAVFEDPRSQAASAFTHIESVRLHSGWNRVLMRIENGSGAHGLYFRVLHDGAAARALPK